MGWKCTRALHTAPRARCVIAVRSCSRMVVPSARTFWRRPPTNHCHTHTDHTSAGAPPGCVRNAIQICDRCNRFPVFTCQHTKYREIKAMPAPAGDLESRKASAQSIRAKHPDGSGHRRQTDGDDCARHDKVRTLRWPPAPQCAVHVTGARSCLSNHAIVLCATRRKSSLCRTSHNWRFQYVIRKRIKLRPSRRSSCR